MNNQDSLRYFSFLSSQPITPTTSKINSCNDFSQYDADFILRYASSQSDVLDLATGTGITLNKYYSYVNSVVAVEKFEPFTQLIVRNPRVEIVISDLKDFQTTQTFDIITMFGIVSYFNEQEIIALYEQYKRFLKVDGKLLIKNQFGVNETVEVNGFSTELQCDYFSQYRYLPREIEILNSVGFNNVEIIDIYPPEFNRWNNTHFYALVATLK